MSIALTSEVVWKGKINVSHSQWAPMAHNNAAVDAKKTAHQMARFFLDASITINFVQK